MSDGTTPRNGWRVSAGGSSRENKFKTKRDSYVWLSNDARHIPVRMSADFAVGSMTATLSAYRPGGQFAATR
jgi:hypothetical protein